MLGSPVRVRCIADYRAEEEGHLSFAFGEALLLHLDSASGGEADGGGDVDNISDELLMASRVANSADGARGEKGLVPATRGAGLVAMEGPRASMVATFVAEREGELTAHEGDDVRLLYGPPELMAEGWALAALESRAVLPAAVPASVGFVPSAFLRIEGSDEGSLAPSSPSPLKVRYALPGGAGDFTSFGLGKHYGLGSSSGLTRWGGMTSPDRDRGKGRSPGGSKGGDGAAPWAETSPAREATPPKSEAVEGLALTQGDHLMRRKARGRHQHTPASMLVGQERPMPPPAAPTDHLAASSTPLLQPVRDPLRDASGSPTQLSSPVAARHPPRSPRSPRSLRSPPRVLATRTVSLEAAAETEEERGRLVVEMTRKMDEDRQAAKVQNDSLRQRRAEAEAFELSTRQAVVDAERARAKAAAEERKRREVAEKEKLAVQRRRAKAAKAEEEARRSHQIVEGARLQAKEREEGARALREEAKREEEGTKAAKSSPSKRKTSSSLAPPVAKAGVAGGGDGSPPPAAEAVGAGVELVTTLLANEIRVVEAHATRMKRQAAESRRHERERAADLERRAKYAAKRQGEGYELRTSQKMDLLEKLAAEGRAEKAMREDAKRVEVEMEMEEAEAKEAAEMEARRPTLADAMAQAEAKADAVVTLQSRLRKRLAAQHGKVLDLFRECTRIRTYAARFHPLSPL